MKYLINTIAIILSLLLIYTIISKRESISTWLGKNISFEGELVTEWCIERRFGQDPCYNTKEEARDLAPSSRLYSRETWTPIYK